MNVTEPEGEVEICVKTKTDSQLGRDVVITTVTGPKSGADDQATGNNMLVTSDAVNVKYMYTMVCS